MRRDCGGSSPHLLGRSKRTMALRRNALHALVGNGFFAATQLAILVALTQFSSPETVGRYSLALAITAPAYLLANLKLRQMAITDAAGEYTYVLYFTCRVGATALVWFAVALPALMLGSSVNWVLLLVSTTKALENISDILYTAPHKHGHLDRVSRFLVLRGSASAAAFIVLIWLGHPIEWALLAMIAIYATSLLWETSEAKKHEQVRLTRPGRSVLSLARVALPLGAALGASSLSTMIPRYALQHSDGVEAVALFSTAAYLLTVGGLVLNSLAQAAAPQLATTLHVHGPAAVRPTFIRLQGAALTLSLVSVGLAAWLGEPVLSMVFGDYYGEADNVLLVLCIATVATYQSALIGTMLNVYRRFEAPLPITSVALIATAFTSLPLAHQWGPVGAATAVVVGALAELLAHLHYLRKGPVTRT